MTGLEPHVSEIQDGSLLCEWISGQQGEAQIRFMLSVEDTGDVIWCFISNTTPETFASGYLPQPIIDRIVRHHG